MFQAINFRKYVNANDFAQQSRPPNVNIHMDLEQLPYLF